jgi:16S rRNA (adenine1518-N6/adenine1519-N6)-dimethyltransferase
LAQRICEKKGTKAYGILSVLVQAFMMQNICLVDECFIPPPKVKSGVLRLRRKKDYSLPCGRNYFHGGSKQLFNNVVRPCEIV